MRKLVLLFLVGCTTEVVDQDLKKPIIICNSRLDNEAECLKYIKDNCPGAVIKREVLDKLVTNTADCR